VTYWSIHDLDQAEPGQALPEIEAQVEDLLRDLNGPH